MKKYRLIKEYPGSPELGEIRTGSEENYRYYPTEKCMKNNPEFWEEVVEKDYEILSFYHKNISGKGDGFVDPEFIWYEIFKGSGKWSRKGYITSPYSTQEIINLNKYGIHSVKRLSDGEIFTVGDVCYPTGKCSYNIGTIDKIEFCKAGYLRLASNNNWYMNIDGIEHSKKPLDKDYEILKQEYVPGYCYHGNQNPNQYKIISIKRLSDGEVFTVGDKITAGTIKRFFINGNSLICVGGKNMDMNISLHVLIPYKKPLFTTEDGVDICEGDSVSVIDNEFNIRTSNWRKHSCIYSDCKYFSSKKAADEYILMNKPCLSINDLLNDGFTMFKSRLIELAKYKL